VLPSGRPRRPTRWNRGAAAGSCRARPQPERQSATSLRESRRGIRFIASNASSLTTRRTPISLSATATKRGALMELERTQTAAILRKCGRGGNGAGKPNSLRTIVDSCAHNEMVRRGRRFESVRGLHRSACNSRGSLASSVNGCHARARADVPSSRELACGAWLGKPIRDVMTPSLVSSERQAPRAAGLARPDPR
jgi:hypothetical protein